MNFGCFDVVLTLIVCGVPSCWVCWVTVVWLWGLCWLASVLSFRLRGFCCVI